MTATIEPSTFMAPPDAWRYDLALILRRYGFFGFDVDNGGTPINRRFGVYHAASDSRPFSNGDTFSVVIADRPDIEPLIGINMRPEPADSFIYSKQRSLLFTRQVPVYKPLFPYVSFSGEALTPIWTTKSGRTVIGWWDHGGQRHLLIGISVVNEIIRYTQGDPQKVFTAKDKTLWGVGHERPAYLYEDNITLGHELVPWADRLGFFLARSIAETSGLPLIAPLPDGAKGGILLTGDDDQAYLEKYDEQLRLLDGFPITYLLLPHTRHAQETLSRMPRNVEYGAHIDALPDPDDYKNICKRQTESVSELVGRKVRSVRNHGHLNRGYWGHLQAWEDSGLVFDVSMRGLDGTCPTGSYLPFHVKRLNGAWSPHISLFSTFSDSMLYLQKWPQEKQISCINEVGDLIERNDPGVIVLNLHPQNVSDFHDAHRAVIKLGRRKNWIALGAESYLNWLMAFDNIRLVEGSGGFDLRSEMPIERLAYHWPRTSANVELHALPKWDGSVRL